MPARKYQEEATYFLRMEAADKAAYEAAAHEERQTLADWINAQLRASLRRKRRRES